jgi:hypothetical protein
MLVAVPLFVRFASLHGGMDLEGSGDEFMGGLWIEGNVDGTLFVGSSGVDATFFLAFFSLVAGVVVAAATGVLDLKKLTGQARELARTMQVQPDQQGQVHGHAHAPQNQGSYDDHGEQHSEHLPTSAAPTHPQEATATAPRPASGTDPNQAPPSWETYER